MILRIAFAPEPADHKHPSRKSIIAAADRWVKGNCHAALTAFHTYGPNAELRKRVASRGGKGQPIGRIKLGSPPIKQ